jgi:hypothetical protein
MVIVPVIDPLSFLQVILEAANAGDDVATSVAGTASAAVSVAAMKSRRM